MMENVFYEPVRQFLNYLQFEKRFSYNTVLAYEKDLEDFFNYLLKEYEGEIKTLQKISHYHIRAWIAVLGIGQPPKKALTAKTINRKISSLRSFFKYHLKKGEIVTLPTVGVITPKIKKRLPVFVKESEILNLLKTLTTTQEDWRTLNAAILIYTFYATGMRLSELINLKEIQLDFSRKLILILGKGNKERLVPLGDKLIELLKGYIIQKNEIYSNLPEEVFVTEKGRALYPKYAYLLVREYLAYAGTLEKRSPHILRHSFATHLMNHGADLNAVKELLGHASLASTQVYTHTSIEKLKEIHKKSHPKA